MSFFNSRSFIGVSLFLSFLILLFTSVWLFSKQHSVLIALIHTMIGFIMLLVVIWHLVKNYRPLANYINPLKKHLGKRNYAFIFAFSLIIYVVISPFFSMAPALQVYQFGQSLRAADKSDQDEELKYVKRNVAAEEAKGQTLTVELTKGPYFMWPQYAIWLETMEGEFVQPLYVTSKLANNEFTNKVSKKDPDQVFTSHMFIGENAVGWDVLTGGNEPETKDDRMRPESLPVFLHKLGMKALNGYFVPTDDSLTVDGYSGATMTDNFIYSIQLPEKLAGQYRVRLELNHSFDYNEYYSSDRFPDDPVYSGNGFSAQPSVIYGVDVDFDDNTGQLSVMKLLGRGHHSGQDGVLYQDTENLTTALELVDRVIVRHKS